MSAISLQRGETYYVKVTGILKTTKEVPTRSGVKYKYIISLEDKKGDIANAEYLSPTPEQTVFVKDAWQYIKCIYKGEMFDAEIEPTEPPSHNVSSALSDGKIEKSSSQARSVGGNSVTFAVAYSKDILIAEMSRWPAERELGEEDIDRMLFHADKIHDFICEKLNH